jgi:hypothetical protein
MRCPLRWGHVVLLDKQPIATYGFAEQMLVPTEAASRPPACCRWILASPVELVARRARRCHSCTAAIPAAST